MHAFVSIELINTDIDQYNWSIIVLINTRTDQYNLSLTDYSKTLNYGGLIYYIILAPLILTFLLAGLKPGFHYPSWRVTGFHSPSTRAVLTGARFH